MIFALFCVTLASFGGVSSAKWEDRIHGNTIVPDGLFPFVASIRCSGKHTASGAIISDTCIVTTAVRSRTAAGAGCVIVVGSNKLNGDGVTYKVNGSVQHPKYVNGKWPYNIGVVKFPKPIEFTSKIKAIRLSNKFPEVGTVLTTASWGPPSASSGSNDLLYANFTTGPPSACEALKLGFNAESEFCSVPSAQTGKCIGGYGSPAFADNELVGVAGYTKCKTNSPTMLCSISAAYDWLNKVCDLEC